MLWRASFRGFVATQLRLANTAAGSNVFEYRSWPSKPTDLPAINLTTPYESKASVGRGAPKFTSLVHLVITGRVTAATEDAVAAALEVLTEQIELATLANAAVVQTCQQFAAVETTTSITSDGGKPLGEVVMVLQAEFYQAYDPAMPDTLTEIDVSRNADMSSPVLKITFPA